MSDRERWIIYPMLFLALGAALKDKMTGLLETKQIQCERLVAKAVVCQGLDITDSISAERPLSRVKLGAAGGWGFVRLPNQTGQVNLVLGFTKQGQAGLFVADEEGVLTEIAPLIRLPKRPRNAPEQ